MLDGAVSPTDRERRSREGPDDVAVGATVKLVDFAGELVGRAAGVQAILPRPCKFHAWFSHHPVY